jgi:hypothetical protein
MKKMILILLCAAALTSTVWSFPVIRMQNKPVAIDCGTDPTTGFMRIGNTCEFSFKFASHCVPHSCEDSY